jgi:hypothetical protein
MLPGLTHMFLELIEVLCKPMYISYLNPRGSQGDTRDASFDPETRSCPLGTPALKLLNPVLLLESQGDLDMRARSEHQLAYIL